MDEQAFWINETLALLTLSLMKGVGYWTIRNLAIQEISFKQVLKAESVDEFSEHLKKAGCKSVNQVAEIWQNSILELWQESLQLYRHFKNNKIEVIHFKHPHFPIRLKEIHEAPQWLFVQGNLSLLHQPAITLVGTRSPSEDGKFLAKYIASCLPYLKNTFADIVTVSGLANGIDQIIHQQSIRFQVPTVAFIGTGILLNYPANSEKLRQKIIEQGGAIVSEYLPSENYSAENFVRRNRLQAGLARVVIPVEWKPRGGTEHTLRYAKAAGRKIICLKLPDWSSSHPELSTAQEMRAEIFTIPGQESDLLNAIGQSISRDSHSDQSSRLTDLSETSKPQKDYYQLSLWTEEL